MFKRVAPAVLCLAFAAPAWAEMPFYDVDAYCKRIAAVGGAPSQSTFGTCMRMEQSAYDQLKPNWDGLPDAMRKYCDRIARVGGDGSYSTLGTCTRMEQGAQQQNDQFKFKR